MIIARHVDVSGRVQGVFFRAWTEEQAERLKVRGWIRNCPDGSVEPVPLPTLPDSSSAERKAWLMNGSSPESLSQAWLLRPLTPDASLAITSDSRSAIGFPDKGIGVNLRLHALLGHSDCPAVDRHPLSFAGDP